MRAAFGCVVLAAFAASAGIALSGLALAQGAAAPGPPIEPQSTGSPASQPAPAQPPAAPPAAAQPAPRPAAPPRAAPVRTVPPGTVPQGVAPQSVVNPRRPRTFAQCNQEALRRGMRGAERRHWIQRCELGYGRPLFRRRGPPANPPAGSTDTTPATQDRGEAGSP